MASSSKVFPTTPPEVVAQPIEKASLSPGKHRSPSPECCSICLGQFRDKSFTDSCFHTFCFSCLQEWAKVKPVCPLCKTSFNSIIHNIKSNEDYERIYLPTPTPSTRSAEDDEARRFRYATTLTQERRFLLEERRMRQFAREARREERRRREETSLGRRRLIYSAGLRVLHMGSNEFSQFRDISPQFFSANPAVTHRLVPWLRRELSVLFDNQDEHVTFMTHYILSLVTNVDIQSEEFHMNLRPFLHDTVEHFVHEFASFARSPYDMDTYDQMSQYDFSGGGLGRVVRALPRRANQPLVASLQRESDSDEPSVILLSDHDSEPMVISDGNVSDDEIEQVPVIGVAETVASNISVDEDLTVVSSEYQEYQPPVFTIDDDLPATNPEPPADLDLPGPSGLQATATASVTESEVHIKEEPPDFHDSDHSDIEFVAFLEAAHLRTPEQLSSESETERIAHEEAERRWQEEKARRKKLRDRMKEMQAKAQSKNGGSSSNTARAASGGSGRLRHRSRSNSYDRTNRSSRRSRSHESRQRRSPSSDIFIHHVTRSRSRDRHNRGRSQSRSLTPPPKTWRERFGYADPSPSPPRVTSKTSKKKDRPRAGRENSNSTASRSQHARSRSRERSQSRSSGVKDSRSKRGSSRSRRDEESRSRRDEESRSRRDEESRSRREEQGRREHSRSRGESSQSRSKNSKDKSHSKHKKSKTHKKHSKKRSRSRSRSKRR